MGGKYAEHEYMAEDFHNDDLCFDPNTISGFHISLAEPLLHAVLYR